MKKKLSLLMLFVGFTALALSQKKSDSSPQKENSLVECELNKNSKQKEAFIDVQEPIKYMSIWSKSKITTGRFIIKIYDPNGKEKTSNLIIDANQNADSKIKLIAPQKKNSKEETNEQDVELKTLGGIGISLQKPKIGKWKILVIPENAEGTLKITYKLHFL